MNIHKKLKKNIDLLMVVVGVVLVWRGVWGLADLYLVPKMPSISFAISIALGLLVLYFHNNKHDLRELL